MFPNNIILYHSFKQNKMFPNNIIIHSSRMIQPDNFTNVIRDQGFCCLENEKYFTGLYSF